MRPEILFPLFAEPTKLDGVGPKTAPLYEKLGIARVVDALFLPPSGVIDRRLRETVQGAVEGTVITVQVTIGRHTHPARRGAPYRITVSDGTLDFMLVFFHAHPEYLTRTLPEGAERIVSGKIEFYDGVAQMPHPDMIVDPAQGDAPDGFEPIYPATAGLNQKAIAKAVRSAVAMMPDLAEWQDAAWLAKRDWPAWTDAIRALHSPESARDIEADAPARQRLAYDELLSHQLALALVRARRRRAKGRITKGDGGLRGKVEAALPFKLTGAQQRAMAEIYANMAENQRMLRLLQGDVGAGKTLVALFAMLNAVETGGQAALMAPTEILARQHLAGLEPLCDIAGIRITLLTGRSKGTGRDEILTGIKDGSISIVVGTHALFQSDVVFDDLRLAVVDEQHRFGVNQRNDLAEKGAGADILVMSATPIPRTLALASYGDMDISVLDEKPPGRKPIETRIVSLTRYDQVVENLRGALAKGARAYWICPLVEESDVIDLAAAEDRARALRRALGEEAVALTHGKLKPAEKDAAMALFKAGERQVLVATTVVEVGVDVPEATIMVIEHAERFGLAQLHQLRGRVGRGTGASSCLLLYQGPLNDTASARLSVLRETEDGFRIAEEDLKLRGAGDLLGIKQAGVPQMRLADLAVHQDLLEVARDDARLIVSQDAELKTPRGEALRVLLYLMGRDDSIRYLGAA